MANNFKLSKKAQQYADKLIKKSKKSEKKLGGIISKSTVKLDDNFEEIKEKLIRD